MRSFVATGFFPVPPSSPEVSVLIVGLSYGVRNLLSYTRRRMQNFLAFRDSPIIPLRCSSPAFLASRSKAPLNERFEQSEGRKSKYGSRDVDLHFDPEMGVSFRGTFSQSLDRSISRFSTVIYRALMKWRSTPHPPTPTPVLTSNTATGFAWETGIYTVGLPFNCDILDSIFVMFHRPFS